MRTAPTEQPSTPCTDSATPSGGGAPASPLATLGQVPWSDIQDSTGPAVTIPLLLTRVAWGEERAARSALDDLKKRICQYGFVVEQATAATVPFLWELARMPRVSCRPQVVQLLKSIAGAQQWESVAAVYPKLLNHPENPVVWERRARQAVRARRGALPVLLADEDGDLARAASELADALEG
ncbi:hypothetical protein [Streptomyces tropicalis]|uniref:AbaA n=1 Tax=Streptomyces tropicalis TaxID=3034234 RepID=A0ABT6AEK1_9ACTN|nr:hypothetical protein [Streptomyces tropicalis]MDF3302898.1 hypothetical protein [Streptomyces tropicalis]